MRFHTFEAEPDNPDDPNSWTITAKLVGVKSPPITVATYRNEADAQNAAYMLNHGGTWKQTGNVFTDDHTPHQRERFHVQPRPLTQD